MNDIEVKDLYGITLVYICQCGAHWYPSPQHGFDSCPWELTSAGKNSCPDRNHGMNPPRKRPKYRKVKKGQANLRGFDVNKAFWGCKERIMEGVI